MTPLEWPWNLHRAAVDRLGWQRPFSSRKGRKRLLLISERDPICHTQYFPFWYHRKELAERYGLETRELSLARFLAGQIPKGPVDAVGFQTWFGQTPAFLEGVIARIREAFPEARRAYFDWFAPTHILLAEVLDRHVHAYVKKQVLRDRSEYDRAILGDTNLSDHYARRLNMPGYREETAYPVPASLWPKLWLSPHFAFSAHMLPRFEGRFPAGKRDIDVHARIAVKGSEWYSGMRQEALEHTLALDKRLTVACRGRVGRNEYFRELYRAKLCFSPFGYGELCWRDFEAMFAGSLVLKPDMSHLDCAPDSFLPGETYVPLAWDLSDLDQKVDYYLAHEEEREAIARRAFEHLAGYFARRDFLDDIKGLLERLELLD
jgi:hypothetical protein